MTARSKIERRHLAEEMDSQIQHGKGLAAPATAEKTHLFEKKKQPLVKPIRHPPVKTELSSAVHRLKGQRFDVEDYTDPFVGIPEVFAAPGPVYEKIMDGMSNHLLYKYMITKDAVMIFFYEPSDPVSQMLRPTVKKAARTTERPNHAYVAVNCRVNRKICELQEICTIPYFKLYSRGRPVGGYDDETSAEDLKRFVEMSPVLEDALKSERKPRED
ncbi:hypothetical protein BsWGS_28334 [Bradybaena similaris]